MPRISTSKLASAKLLTPPVPAQEDARRIALHLSRAFEAMIGAGIRHREAYSDLLRAALVDNPAFLGMWTVWEPDALGGSDRSFRNARAHDVEGRFVPYWNREGDDLQLDMVTGYESPDEGNWYWIPKQHRRPCTAEPYLYPVRGQLRWIASELAPVAARGLVLGVVGVDWTIDPQAVKRRDGTAAPIIHVLGGSVAAEKLSALTTREHEVYFWLSQGKSNEEISIILGISAHTVKNHLDHIFQKLGVCNRLAAALAVQAEQ